MNKAILIGRAGKDAELSEANGRKKATFTVATTERWKKDGEKVEHTTWHNIECWGNLAEICGQYLKKGTLVSIDGRIRVEQWEKDGAKKSRTYILADAVDLLSRSGEAEPAKEQGKKDTATEPTNTNDDLPF